MIYILGAWRINSDSLLKGLWPYIGMDDRKLAPLVSIILAQVEAGDGRHAGFSHYVGMIGNCVAAGVAIPSSLFRYMFERAPGDAMVACMGAYPKEEPRQQDWRRIKLAEHTISETLWKQENGVLTPHETEPATMEELKWLSEYDRWWARMYVAEMLRQHPEFRTAAVLKRLAEDRNEVVRSVALPLLKEPLPAPLTDVERAQVLATAAMRHAASAGGPGPKQLADLAEWFNVGPAGNRDYEIVARDMVLVAKGKIIGLPDADKTVLVYRKPKEGDKTVAVGYLDGNAKDVPMDVFQKQLAASLRVFAGATTQPASRAQSQP